MIVSPPCSIVFAGIGDVDRCGWRRRGGLLARDWGAFRVFFRGRCSGSIEGIPGAVVVVISRAVIGCRLIFGSFPDFVPNIAAGVVQPQGFPSCPSWHQWMQLSSFQPLMCRGIDGIYLRSQYSAVAATLRRNCRSFSSFSPLLRRATWMQLHSASGPRLSFRRFHDRCSQV